MEFLYSAWGVVTYEGREECDDFSIHVGCDDFTCIQSAGVTVDCFIFAAHEWKVSLLSIRRFAFKASSGSAGVRATRDFLAKAQPLTA